MGVIDFGKFIGALAKSDSPFKTLVTWFETLIDNIAEYLDYIIGFFSYLFETSKNLLSGGNVLIFVLFILLIWKLVKKLV